MALKGKIDFNKSIQQNLIHKERFYTEHQVYDYEHIVNQIILKGLVVLDDLTFNSYLKDRIKKLKMTFLEIKEIDIQKYHFDKIKINRKSILYNKAIQIAQMILLNYSPDIRSGQENMLTLLFDMNKLWEQYIYQMLLKTNRTDIKVSFQNRENFWETRTIRPDIVLEHKKDNKILTYVIDTKWKLLDTTNPKPSDDDLKQMFSYNLYWNAKRSMLLYPNSNEINESFGRFWKGADKPENNQCKVGFIHVLNDQNQLDFEIGNKILEKIIE